MITASRTRPAAIELKGVSVHNLKGIEVRIPLRQLTIVTGVSGAGKSSLVIDTLYAESQRRYLQSFSAYTRQFLERLDRPEVEQILHLPPALAVTQRAWPRGQRSTVGTLTEIVDFLRLLVGRFGSLRCRSCGLDIRPASVAEIIGEVERFPPGTRFQVAFPVNRPAEQEAEDWLGLLRENGYVRVQLGGQAFRLEDLQAEQLGTVTRLWVILDRLETGRVTVERLTDSLETAFSLGRGCLGLFLEKRELLFDQRWRCPRCDITYPPLDPRLISFNDPAGACPACGGTGVVAPARGRKTIGSYRLPAQDGSCPVCQGSRLSEPARLVHLRGQNLADLCRWDLEKLQRWCQTLDLAAEVLPLSEGKSRKEGPQEVQLLLQQINLRLESLLGLGLGYLTLERAAGTLSTGEVLRIRLSNALCSTLVNALYVLEEPTAGLHAEEVARIVERLRRLRDLGNTVVVIEHEPAVIRAGDHVIDLGPAAGEEGGTVCYEGPPEGLTTLDCPTGRYLGGTQAISVPRQRRPLRQGTLRLVDANQHNLRNLTVEFPLKVLCVISGVSGSGKSTLLVNELHAALERRMRGAEGGRRIEGTADVYGVGQLGEVVLMDQSPISRSSRSNVATYLRVFDAIREVFADTTEARIRNLDAGAFSFNQPGGRCETCEGQGTLTVDMQFLADVSVTCPDCKGTRYRPDVLQVKVRSLQIAEVLELTAREAFRFFRAHPGIERRLKMLLDVGLDYLRLGQAVETLSGGECQRLKLAAHLASSRKPRCLFLLDEPTVGLHPADVARLLDCFDGLLRTGQSLIVIEHNLDVIKCADYVIDLGPGAGPQGGRLVVCGTPEQVAAYPKSVTGKWLQRVLG